MPNTKQRATEIYTAAASIVEAAGGPAVIDEMVDSQARLVLYRTMYQDVMKATNCSISSAKSNVAKAMRRGRYAEMVKNWGGARPGAGYPKGQSRKSKQD